MAFATDSETSPVIVLQIDALAPQRVSRWAALGLLPGFSRLHELSGPVGPAPIHVDKFVEVDDAQPSTRVTRFVGAWLAQMIPGAGRLHPDGLSIAWQALAGDPVSLRWSRQLIDDMDLWRRFSRQWSGDRAPAARLRLRAGDCLSDFVPAVRQSGEPFIAAQATLLTYQVFDRIVLAALAFATANRAELIVSGPQSVGGAWYRHRVGRADRRPERLAA